MKTFVVYDSVFGNTERVARAIGDAVGAAGDVAVRRVGNVTLEELKGAGLLVVGSPTRQFKATPATASFIESIPAGLLKGIRVAAFDTRIAERDVASPVLRFIFVRLARYAAKYIGDTLQARGGDLAVPPEGFIVCGQQGPLKDGELERATIWAKAILTG